MDNAWSKEEFANIFQFQVLYADDLHQNYYLLETGLCQDVYPNVTEMAISSEGFVDAYCPKNFSAPVFGNPEIGGTGWLSVFINRCKNSTSSSVTCYSPEKIKNLLQYTKFQVIYIEKLVYPNNYDEPLTKTTSVYWDYLEFGIMKNIEFYYKTVTIQTDIGLIVPTLVNTTDVLFDNKLYSKQLHVTDPGYPFVQVDILVTNKNVYVKRTYDKLQNVFANIGGIIKSLMLVGQILVIIYNNKVMQLDMVNSFYDFSDFNDHPKQINVNTKNKLSKNFYANFTNNVSRTVNQKDITVNNNSLNNKGLELSQLSPGTIRIFRNNNNLSNIDNEMILENTNRKDIKELTEEYKKFNSSLTSKSMTQLLYTPAEVLKLALCPGKFMKPKLLMTSKILSSSYDYVKAVLDLASMVKTTHELTLVKTLLLNENQMEFADHTKKTKFTDKLMNPDPDKMIKSLCEYYKEKNMYEMSEIDKKLFTNLNENMLKLLQKY